MTLAPNGLTTGTKIYTWTFADTATRVGATGFVAGDVGSVALQLDDGSLWRLTATTPTWQGIAGAPAAHAATHATGGGDPVSPASIGAVATGDSRLADARTPTAHASSHQVGGSDAFAGIVPGSAFAPGGLTGATAATRYVGGTASAAPTTGTFAIGDFVIDQSGKVWVCTAAGTPGTWAQAGGGGAWTLVGETVLATAAASITFAAIPQTGKHLALYVVGRTTGAFVVEELGLRCNGDAAANYQASGGLMNNGGVTAAQYTADSSLWLGAVAGASAGAATQAGFAATTIYDYTRTTFLTLARAVGGRWDGTTRSATDITSYWSNTAAITSLTLVGRSGGNLAAGTRAALYIIS